MADLTIPFMTQNPNAPLPLWNPSGSPGAGHPLASIDWFTGNNVGASSYGSGVPFAQQYGGFGTNPSAVPGQPAGLWDKFKGVMGSEGFQTGVSTFGNLANIYMGFKSLGLAKDQLQFAKSSFNKNFNAQAQAYNNDLRDRWESKSNAHATRGRSYEGMDSWLADRQIDKTGKDKG